MNTTQNPVKRTFVWDSTSKYTVTNSFLHEGPFWWVLYSLHPDPFPFSIHSHVKIRMGRSRKSSRDLPFNVESPTGFNSILSTRKFGSATAMTHTWYDTPRRLRDTNVCFTEVLGLPSGDLSTPTNFHFWMSFTPFLCVFIIFTRHPYLLLVPPAPQDDNPIKTINVVWNFLC